jgi:hypothetical protein
MPQRNHIYFLIILVLMGICEQFLYHIFNCVLEMYELYLFYDIEKKKQSSSFNHWHGEYGSEASELKVQQLIDIVNIPIIASAAVSLQNSFSLCSIRLLIPLSKEMEEKWKLIPISFRIFRIICGFKKK